MKKSTIKFLKDVWGYLDGKKTYIAGALIAITAFCESQGWITTLTATNLYALFTGLGLVTLRMAKK